MCLSFPEKKCQSKRMMNRIFMFLLLLLWFLVDTTELIIHIENIEKLFNKTNRKKKKKQNDEVLALAVFFLRRQHRWNDTVVAHFHRRHNTHNSRLGGGVESYTEYGLWLFYGHVCRLWMVLACEPSKLRRRRPQRNSISSLAVVVVNRKRKFINHFFAIDIGWMDIWIYGMLMPLLWWRFHSLTFSL